MFIEFNVGNYRSIKNKCSFSMVAAPLTAQDKSLDERNVFQVNEDLKLLKSSAIYGANASGKSNLIAAVNFMRKFVRDSARESRATDLIPVEPFRLSTETIEKPSSFEILFIMDGQQYRYGFEVMKERVVAEWLYYVPTSREARLFERKDGQILISSAFKEGRGLEERTRDNALFLSVVASWNGQLAQKIFRWLMSQNVISGLRDESLLASTSKKLEDDLQSAAIVALVRDLDIGIHDIYVSKISEDDVPSEMKEFISEVKKFAEKRGEEFVFSEIKTTHPRYDSNGAIESFEIFNLKDHESAGTQRIVTMAAPILDTLQKGQVLFIDEFDARLHPLLTRALLGMFNSKEINSKNAQLIFVTHDTNLLSKDILRRDQIWFAEKDRFGATSLFSLAEFKVRNDASFESNYIQGRYGAIPFIGDLTHILGEANA